MPEPPPHSAATRGLSAEDWATLRELVPDALALPAESRVAFLRKQTQGKSAQFVDLASDLIAAADLQSSPIDRPVLCVSDSPASNSSEALSSSTPPVASDVAAEAKLARLPTQLGPWRLTGLIGEGGMGAVYSAERTDGAFERKVAIKVLTRIGSAHHAQEARALARLEHAGIARLYDAGILDIDVGQRCTYLIIELVQGRPITEVAASLNTADSLWLFLQVCDTVAYAHQAGVVHGDLKPANILVDDARAVHLLDFGVARILGVSPLGEMPIAPAVTLAYAAPEQLLGGASTPQSDVFALGTLLGELVPERARAPALAAVVARARALQPADRYLSVALLGAEVRRYLAHRPVEALAHDRPYRLLLWTRRHRWTLSAAVIIAVILSASAFINYRQSAATAEQSGLAADRSVLAHEAARTLIYDVHESLRNLDGTTQAREAVLLRAIGHLDGLAATGVTDTRLLVDLAGAYYKVGYVQGIPGDASLGKISNAATSFRSGLAVLPAPVAAGQWDTTAVNVERIRGRLLEKLGSVSARTGDLAGGLNLIDSARTTFQQALRRAPEDGELATYLGGALINLGDFTGHPYFPNDGQPERALRMYLEARQVLAEIPVPARLLYTERLAGLTYERQATLLTERGDWDAACGVFEQALTFQSVLLGRADVNEAARRDYAVAEQSLGSAHRQAGRPQVGLPYLLRSVDYFTNRTAADGADRGAQVDLGFALLNLAQAELGPDGPHLARTEVGRAHYRAAIALFAEASAADPEDAGLKESLDDVRGAYARVE